MQLKPWMINPQMWASGMKANEWMVPDAWLQLSWFAQRKPQQWNQPQIDYFDYTCTMMMQKDTGWN
jgi:hypothetical protein